MNRKLLSFLLVIPVVVFASDKILHMDIKNSSLGANTQIDEIHSDAIINDDEMVTEMKILIKDLKGREKAFRESKYISVWDQQVNDEQRTFLRNNVVKKLESKNICQLDLQKSFSRCPSGYDAVVITKDKVITSEGWMICRSGCDENPITKFRFDTKTGLVECKVSDKAGYLKLDDFCKLYKTAKASM